MSASCPPSHTDCSHVYIGWMQSEAPSGQIDRVMCACPGELNFDFFNWLQGRQHCLFMDSKGLVCASRNNLQPHKLPFAHDLPFQSTLLDALKAFRPTALIGVSAVPNAFSPDVIKVQQPLVKFSSSSCAIRGMICDSMRNSRPCHFLGTNSTHIIGMKHRPCPASMRGPSSSRCPTQPPKQSAPMRRRSRAALAPSSLPAGARFPLSLLGESPIMQLRCARPHRCPCTRICLKRIKSNQGVTKTCAVLSLPGYCWHCLILFVAA